MDHLCYLCLVFYILSQLFIATSMSPAGKGLASWLFFVMSNCAFVTFPCGILGQVWYLIVSIRSLPPFLLFLTLICFSITYIIELSLYAKTYLLKLLKKMKSNSGEMFLKCCNLELTDTVAFM